MAREHVSAPRGEVSRARRFRALTAAAAFGVLLAGLTAVVIAAGRGPLPVDQAVHEWALAHRTAPSTAVALALEVLGSGVPAYLVVAVVGAVACTPRRWSGALTAAVALAVGQLIRFAFAAAVARPRPPRSGWIEGASGWSFPSGHATTSAIVAGLVWVAASRRLRGWRLRLAQGLALAWAGAVGWSRIYLGVHWPTDVIAGWLLAGVLVLVGCGLLADRWEALPHPATPDEADSA
jgi:membrane-associated phospholipid phosphatase